MLPMGSVGIFMLNNVMIRMTDILFSPVFRPWAYRLHFQTAPTCPGHLRSGCTCRMRRQSLRCRLSRGRWRPRSRLPVCRHRRPFFTILPYMLGYVQQCPQLCRDGCCLKIELYIVYKLRTFVEVRCCRRSVRGKTEVAIVIVRHIRERLFHCRHWTGSSLHAAAVPQ